MSQLLKSKRSHQEHEKSELQEATSHQYLTETNKRRKIDKGGAAAAAAVYPSSPKENSHDDILEDLDLIGSKFGMKSLDLSPIKMPKLHEKSAQSSSSSPLAKHNSQLNTAFIGSQDSQQKNEDFDLIKENAVVSSVAKHHKNGSGSRLSAHQDRVADNDLDFSNREERKILSFLFQEEDDEETGHAASPVMRSLSKFGMDEQLIEDDRCLEGFAWEHFKCEFE